VFKVGGAYLPIDPILPQLRIEHIIHESKPSILLTKKKYITPAIELFSLTKTRLELFENFKFSNTSTPNLNISVLPNALAYVPIYKL
jgi:non-ribosomal peptide synthetase component F